MALNINKLINIEKKKFDQYYKNFLKSTLLNDRLSKAMIYGSINGGKRIRPFFVSIFSKIAKIKPKNYLRLSTAIECIHSYSLIHDDLPSMDDDDYRRGKLSVHKKFDEATAILSGDALHDLAFEILSNKETHNSLNVRLALIKKLSKCLGFNGLAGGQSLDLLFEKKNIKKNQILKMYTMKTATLFNYSCSSPFILAKKKKSEIKFAEEFGNLYGLIFQISDDIIDQLENFNYLGKTPGKDLKQGKSTLISSIGRKKTIVFCDKLTNDFKKNNKKFFKSWKILDYILTEKINSIKKLA